MALYNPGDRVVVRHDIEENRRYFMVGDHTISDVATSGMVRLAGQVCTIGEVTSYGKYRIKEYGANWTDEMFFGKALELDDPHIESASSLFE